MAVVPINYQYPLSAAIYKILNQASPEYAAFLHDRGYTATSGRLMKLFTFSKLWIPRVRQQGRALRGGPGVWRLLVGSPMLEEFVQNFVLGLFELAEIAVGGQGIHAEFRVEQVEALPVPDFRESTRFKCLSPVVASTEHEREGRKQIYYYRPEDAELSQALRENLLQKYEIIHGKPPTDDRLLFHLQPGDKPKSKLITIKEGTVEETRIKAFETYFTLEGSTELMQVAWECGLGEHTSQGFGMVEVVRSEK
jgi:CRISPR-associated endoribonuclease Cas6